MSHLRLVRVLFAFGVVGIAGLMSAGPAPSVAQPITPQIGGCSVFPIDNIWNARVDSLPVDTHSGDYINSIGPSTTLHPDFGTFYQNAPSGIPFAVVSSTQPTVPIAFFPLPDGNAGESDPGPMPIPPDAPVEGGDTSTGDRHVLVVRQGECKLYELFNAHKGSDNSWTVSSSAVYDLNSNALRPDSWTSADAAGLPMLPGLVRYDEVKSGAINHAIRFTVNISQKSYVWPGRHYASNNTSLTRPPMAQRFRLKASVDISAFPTDIQVIFTAFKRYGIIVADNGSDWYISGAHDTRWNDDLLVTNFRKLKGSDFEAVNVSSLMVNKDSGQVKGAVPSPTRTPIGGTATPQPTAGPSPTPPMNVTPRAYIPLVRR